MISTFDNGTILITFLFIQIYLSPAISLHFFVVLVTSSLRVKPRQALYLFGSVLIEKPPCPFLHGYADTSLVPSDPCSPTVARFESHIYQRVLHTSFPSSLSSSPPAAYRQELLPAVGNQPHESTIFDYMNSRRVVKKDNATLTCAVMCVTRGRVEGAE
jgi:hypothetical protein